MATHSSSPSRALALDALRGLAILAMLLSGQLPFDGNALPAWMYHAQVPPPDFRFNPQVYGISWVDLVFPFFLFAMGAAFPLALARRMENKPAPWKLFWFVAERGFLLGFFALFVQLIRPYTLNNHPTTATWLLALLGFFIFFPTLMRLPETWSRALKISIRATGWLAAILFCALVTYPDGSGFKLTRSDIIIVVLTNMAVFGSAIWMLTRNNWLVRVGLIGLVLAIRLSNMPVGLEGWVHDLWTASPAPWIYSLYYLQYLCIVIPGTIAGDMIWQWTRGAGAPPPRVDAMPSSRNARSISGSLKPGDEASPAPLATPASSPPSWPLWRYVSVLLVMLAMVLVALIGLKARWLTETALGIFSLCLVGWMLLRAPLNETEALFKKLFNWAIYWLVLGLILETYEGGIRKDKATVSYYFITSGLAICTLIGFTILIEVWNQKRALRLLIDNGQNPMIAYAGINNFITPVLALTGGATLLTQFATSPWRGFCKGAIITLLMALVVSFLTRRKIFWRT
jgi:predicted acyltransferase